MPLLLWTVKRHFLKDYKSYKRKFMKSLSKSALPVRGTAKPISKQFSKQLKPVLSDQLRNEINEILKETLTGVVHRKNCLLRRLPKVNLKRIPAA